MERRTHLFWLLIALNSSILYGCGSGGSSSPDSPTNIEDSTENENEPKDEDNIGDDNNDDDDSDNEDGSENEQFSYLNEAWFSLSAQACMEDDGALILNNGQALHNQTSSNLSCSLTTEPNALVYSINWQGDDFDRDGTNDHFSFDLRVRGYNGSTYSYSETPGESSVTAIGEAANLSVWSNGDESVWDIADDDSAGQAAGQTLRFTIENSNVSINGYRATFNGFNYIELMETDGGNTHTHIRGEGNALDSGSFSTPTADYHLTDINELVITGAGDTYPTRAWGISDLQFSFSINNPDQTSIWEATDLSLQGTGPTYSDIYPAQDPARQALFPDFSWDSVPRWLAVRNNVAYSDEQIELIANNYQLVMLEKANKAGFDSVDEGIKNTASRLKAINPDIKTLFYWNTQIFYAGYSNDDEYQANASSWSELNDDGSIYLFKDIYYWYNESVAEMRDWWVNLPVEVVKDENIDGVFIDKMPKAAVDELFVDGEPVTDYINMMNTLWESLPEDKMLIGNNLRGERNNASRALMEILDGSYLERWNYTLDHDFPAQTTADAISLSMQLMREALAQGKMINFQTDPQTDQEEPASYQDKLDYMADHVDFPLAIFLIIAEENAFFSYQLGVNATPSAENIWDSSYIDELNRPLGEPLGDPIKDGYIYTRSYEYVDIWVDVETQQAQLTWRDEATQR